MLLLCSFQPILLHPQAKLHWRKVANLPVGMGRPQVVAVGESVYVGGGLSDSEDDRRLVFQYDTARDKWTILPPSCVAFFGLAQLSGKLLTVGGEASDGTITKKVYRYRSKLGSRKWVEFLQPMPTARAYLTVISTQSALIACGGRTHYSNNDAVMPCTTVEVYTTETSQWHPADPLLIPGDFLTSTTVGNTGYLLGGEGIDDKLTKTALYAPVASLIQTATSRPQQPASAARPDSTSSVWKTLQDTPLWGSAAVGLGGMLLAIGGEVEEGQDMLSAVHVYSPTSSSWIRVESGDLPVSQSGCTAIELPGNRLFVIGGVKMTNNMTDTVFLGSFTIEL